MKKNSRNVFLEIKSVQDGEESSVFISDAKMHRVNNKSIIEFDGTEICGIPGEITKFVVDDEQSVSMVTGKNPVKSTFMLERGVKQNCFYTNDFTMESVLVGFMARRIKSTLGDNGGDVEIDYTVEMNNYLASQNSMHLSVRGRDK